MIATTVDDWRVIEDTAIFNELERHAAPIFLEIPPRPYDRPNWVHSVLGHKYCCEAVFQKKAYRILTVPDYIYADGAVASLHDLAEAGAQAVLINVQPRIVDEPFFAALKEMGILPSASRRDTGTPLVYSARQLVSAALQSLHSMTIVNEWTAPYFCRYAATPWWRVDDEADGIVICGLGWNPLLIDYAAVQEHDVSLIDSRGLDGDYDMRTIGHLKTIYTIRDSDEIYAASWSSLSYMAQPLRRQIFGEIGKGAAFRASYYSPQFNWLHRALLFVPVRLHAGPLGEKWDETEERALRTLLTWLDPPPELGELGRDLPIARREYQAIEAKIAVCQRPIKHFFMLFAARLLYPIYAPPIRWLLRAIRVGSRRALWVLHGDEVARRWWWWQLRRSTARLFGRAFHDTKPETPA